MLKSYVCRNSQSQTMEANLKKNVIKMITIKLPSISNQSSKIPLNHLLIHKTISQNHLQYQRTTPRSRLKDHQSLCDRVQRGLNQPKSEENDFERIPQTSFV